jgi:hypothetical protein
MTEAEWLATDDWLSMFRALGDVDRSRKLRLWCVGWARLLLSLAEGPEGHSTFENVEGFFTQSLIEAYKHEADAGEKLADGLITRRAIHGYKAKSGGPYNVFHFPLGISRLTVDAISGSLTDFTDEFKTPSSAQLAALHREIFGNPFRPATIDPWWCTSTVTELAKGIYSEKTFHLMPILADALQDAGCGNADILNHCRQPGQHVKGCWLVDLLLGKK